MCPWQVLQFQLIAFFNVSVMKMMYLDRKYLCLLLPLTKVLFFNGEELTCGSVWLIWNVLCNFSMKPLFVECGQDESPPQPGICCCTRIPGREDELHNLKKMSNYDACLAGISVLRLQLGLTL